MQVSKFNNTYIKDIILVQLLARKSRKYHDISDLNLNDLEIAFTLNGKL